MSTNIREVKVTKEWLMQLKEYLHPEERWVDEKGAVVLYSYDWEDGDSIELHFKMEGK